MINPSVEREIVDNLSDLMIDSSKVAYVSDYHNLSHAMLILTAAKYSIIPVLNKESQLVGLLNLAVIVKAITELDGINPEKLEEMKVAEVMLDLPLQVTLEDSFEKVFHALVDQNFLGVTDRQGKFIGIITRRNLLKRLNQYFHNLA